VRFSEFVRDVSINQEFVSYNALTPTLELDEDGIPRPYRPKNLRLRPIDVQRLLTPYVAPRFVDQLKAVVPLALYLVLFQIVVLRQTVGEPWSVSWGLAAVIIGLMLFMEGLRLGLMPFAETIGDTLPKKSKLPVVLIIAFMLGVGVTVAEPAIGALQVVGSIVDVRKAPYLHVLLTEWTAALLLAVGVGVGLATVIGTLRFLNGWSLKPLVYLTLAPTLALTVYCAADPELAKVLGLAWDCGAVTTGPVTVPIVLALGIGIAAAGGKGESSLAGFGIITLASLFPIIGVMTLAVFVASQVSPEVVIQNFEALAAQEAPTPWYAETPAREIVNGFRAVVPLIIFLFLVLRFVLGEKVREAGILGYGLLLCVLGMIVFGVGLSYGLSSWASSRAAWSRPLSRR
jgi:hypothetical protein